MNMLGKIYKCPDKNKEYNKKYITPLVKSVYSINTGLEALDSTMETIDNYANGGNYINAHFGPAIWAKIKPEIIENIIDTIGDLVHSKDEFIKTCCVSENRKLKFPLGYSTSYLLNSAAISYMNYYLNNGFRTKLTHIDNGQWAIINFNDSFQDDSLHRYSQVFNNLEDNDLSKIHNYYTYENYFAIGYNTYKLGPHLVSGRYNRGPNQEIFSLYGQSTFDKYYDYITAAAKYLVLKNWMLPSSTYGYELRNPNDLPTEFIQAHNLEWALNDFRKSHRLYSTISSYVKRMTTLLQDVAI